MLVGMLVVLKASTRQPEGMSKVRMMESSEAVMSHRESGEKACKMERGSSVYRDCEKLGEEKRDTHNIENATLETRHLTNDPLRLDIDDSNDEIVTDDSEESVVSVESEGGDRRRKGEGLKSDGGVEIEELAKEGIDASSSEFVSEGNEME